MTENEIKALLLEQTRDERVIMAHHLRDRYAEANRGILGDRAHRERVLRVLDEIAADELEGTLDPRSMSLAREAVVRIAKG